MQLKKSPNFVSHSLSRSGPNWVANVWTVQDYEVNEDIIYAIGEVKTSTKVQTLDNRASIIVNGRPRFRINVPIYRQAEYKTCLRNVLEKLVTIGKQHE